MTDYDFLRLLFVSSGCDELWESIGGFTGYGWSPSNAMIQQFRDDGLLTPEMEKEAEVRDHFAFPTINWIEYQAKLVTGTLSDMKKHYEP